MSSRYTHHNHNHTAETLRILYDANDVGALRAYCAWNDPNGDWTDTRDAEWDTENREWIGESTWPIADYWECIIEWIANGDIPTN